ncbi:metallopeptidase TldD-related protein [Actinosynnema sp. NPDC053489]|uniref:metallopeptidase TldD-related protein n=1 Tax=Actinosynnema sp. NPDC053489 TaxID=3363916 RepID=UPI0037C99AF8
MRTPQDVAESALAEPGDRVVIVDETSTAYLRWAGNAVTGNGVVHSRALTVVESAPGARIGVVSREGALTGDAVRAAVEEARATARRAAPASDALPLPDAWERQWSRPPTGTSIGALAGVVAQLAEVFDRARSRGDSTSGYAEHRVRTTYLASTSGLRLHHAQPGGVLDLTAHGADRTASAWAGSEWTDPAEADVLGAQAATTARLDTASRRADLSPGRYDVILAPSCVADLMTHLHRAADLREALDGGTVFSGPDGGTRLGERLTDARLTLASDPAEPGLGCLPFTVVHAPGPGSSCFDNGTPLRRTEWLRDGALANLVTTRHAARAAGLPHTPRIGNLVLSGSRADGTLEDLVARTDHGLLVTSLWYLREVDPSRLLLTGVTRDGVHVVKGGEVVGTAPDLRFEESPVELLARVSEVGRTGPALPREWGDREFRTAMPALRVEGFALTSTGAG